MPSPQYSPAYVSWLRMNKSARGGPGVAPSYAPDRSGGLPAYPPSTSPVPRPTPSAPAPSSSTPDWFKRQVSGDDIPDVDLAYQDYLRKQQRWAPAPRRSAKKLMRYDWGGVPPPQTTRMPASASVVGGQLPSPYMPSLSQGTQPELPGLDVMPDLSAGLDEDESYSEVQVYWRKAAGLAYVAAGTDQYLYTKPLPTDRFREVVAQFLIDAEIPPNSSIVVAPQVSMDMTNWDTQSTLTTISPGGTYPKVILSKYTTVGAYMRFQLKLCISAGAATVGGTFEIISVGRT